MNKLQNCLHVTMQSQVLSPLIFLSYCTFTVLPALSALRQKQACSNSNASAAKTHGFHTLVPTSGTISPQDIRHSATLFLQKQTQNICFLQIYQFSPNISVKQQSVSVCVYVCVYVCTLHIVMLEPLLVCTLWLCVSFC